MFYLMTTLMLLRPQVGTTISKGAKKLKDLLNFFDKPKDPLAFEGVKIGLASPTGLIHSLVFWRGEESLKQSTTELSNQKEMVLFCAKDLSDQLRITNVLCGKYKRMKFRGVVCEKVWC